MSFKEKEAERIKRMNSTQLSRFWRLCFERLNDPLYQDRKEKINIQINLIKQAWRNPDNFNLYNGRVELGVMGAMAYHVGDTEGVKEPYRRDIIREVVIGPIPMVGNPRYMDWWGDDCTERRLQAVKSFLMDKINSPQHRNHHRAITEWKNDLAWIEEIGHDILKDCRKIK